MSGTERSHDEIAYPQNCAFPAIGPMPAEPGTLNREIGLIEKMKQLSPGRCAKLEYTCRG